MKYSTSIQKKYEKSSMFYSFNFRVYKYISVNENVMIYSRSCHSNPV